MTDRPAADAVADSVHGDVARSAVRHSREDLERWLTALAVCADRTRLTLLVALHAAPDASVTQLAEAVGLGPNAVTQALRRLEEAGVAEPRRDGRYRRWRLTDPTVHALLHEIRAPHSTLHPEHSTPELHP